MSIPLQWQRIPKKRQFSPLDACFDPRIAKSWSLFWNFDNDAPKSMFQSNKYSNYILQDKVILVKYRYTMNMGTCQTFNHSGWQPVGFSSTGDHDSVFPDNLSAYILPFLSHKDYQSLLVLWAAREFSPFFDLDLVICLEVTKLTSWTFSSVLSFRALYWVVSVIIKYDINSVVRNVFV